MAEKFEARRTKGREPLISALCQHLRSAVDVLELLLIQSLRAAEAAAAECPKAKEPVSPPNLLPNKLAYTINEAAEALGLGRSTLYKLINAGTLETIKIGNRTLILAESLQQIVRSNQRKPCPKPQ